MENQAKFLLCAKYDARIALKNRRLGALEEHATSCSDCGTKVLITRASLDLLRADKQVKPVCQDCAEIINQTPGKAQYAATPGQLREIARLLAKIRAAKN